MQTEAGLPRESSLRKKEPLPPSPSRQAVCGADLRPGHRTERAYLGQTTDLGTCSDINVRMVVSPRKKAWGACGACGCSLEEETDGTPWYNECPGQNLALTLGESGKTLR